MAYDMSFASITLGFAGSILNAAAILAAAFIAKSVFDDFRRSRLASNRVDNAAMILGLLYEAERRIANIRRNYRTIPEPEGEENISKVSIDSYVDDFSSNDYFFSDMWSKYAVALAYFGPEVAECFDAINSVRSEIVRSIQDEYRMIGTPRHWDGPEQRKLRRSVLYVGTEDDRIRDKVRHAVERAEHKLLPIIRYDH